MDLDGTLERLAADPCAPADLAAVALMLAGDEYPDLDVPAALARIDRLADAVQPPPGGDAEAQAARLARYLFEEQGFGGNAADYYDPRNSYLNEVLDRRLGIPISLSVLAVAVGTRAGLDVSGVGLPGHFIAKVTHAGREAFFDPFHGGRLLTARECGELVERVTGRAFAATPAALRAAPPGWVVARMLTNLKGIYLQTEDYARAARVTERLRQLAPGDPVQRRDLGVCLLRAGRPGRAIDHLEAYLRDRPEATDAPEVGEYLALARREVARWN